MRTVSWAIAAALIGGCADQEAFTRPAPAPGIELSTVEAAACCRPIGAVEVQSGQRDPTSHELLRAFAAERGANYVVLDAFGVLTNIDDVFAVTRARLFQCPIALVCYRCQALQ